MNQALLEMAEGFVCTSKTLPRQPVEPPARTPRLLWIDVFPFTVKPARRLKAQHDWVECTGGNTAPLLDFHTGHLLIGISEEDAQDLQACERQSRLFAITHACISTQGIAQRQVGGVLAK